MSRKSTKMVKAFNELLNKVLDVLCIAWFIGWFIAGVMFMVRGNPIVTLLVAILYGSPAPIWLIYRYTHYYKDKFLEKKMNNNLV